MAGETDVEDGGTDVLVLHDIYHAGYQRTSLPSKGTTGLEDNLQPRIALMESLHETNQALNVVVLARNQMTTTKVDPLNLREPLRELLFDMLQRALKDVAATLTMTMAMETLDIAGQRVRQFVGRNTKAGAWSTGIVEQRLYLRILRIDAQSQRARSCPFMEPLIL